MLTRQSDNYFVGPKIVANQVTSFQKSQCPQLDYCQTLATNEKLWQLMKSVHELLGCIISAQNHINHLINHIVCHNNTTMHNKIFWDFINWIYYTVQSILYQPKCIYFPNSNSLMSVWITQTFQNVCHHRIFLDSVINYFNFIGGCNLY